MAAQALLWEEPVELSESGDIGGLLHYYTESAQALFLEGTDLVTRLMTAPEGNYSAPGDAFTIDNSRVYSEIRLDHPSLGIAYGAVSGSGLHLMTYIYAADISDWAVDVSISIQANNPLHSMSMSIADTDREYFEGDDSLFSPGNVISLEVTWGMDAEWLPLYIWYIDSLPYSELTHEHTLQARTMLGMWLRDVTYDENNAYSGRRDEVVAAIIGDGATILDQDDIIVQPDATAVEVTFKPSDRRLDALLKWLEPVDWRVAQLPDGRVVAGNNAFIRTYLPNTRYSFQRDRDVFTRSITRNADAAYSRVCAYAGEFARMQYADIPTFPGWELSNKTYYEKGPPGSHEDGDMTDAELLALAQTLAAKMQYAGVTETVDGPMRPELLPDDVAQIYNEGAESYTVTGIVTGVKHQLGRNGYKTVFTTDSGGDYTDVGDYVESKSRIIDGANRERHITDFIRKASSQSVIVAASGSSAGLAKKADKVTGATAGRLAGLDAYGNLTDSGKAPDDLAGAARDACRAYRNSALSIPDSTSTAVTLPSEDYDQGGMHDIAVNPSRITIQTAGIYAVMAAVVFDTDGTGTRRLEVKLNGTTVLSTIEASPLSAANTAMQAIAMATLEEDDYIEIFVTQNSGNALDVTSAWLTAAHISN